MHDFRFVSALAQELDAALSGGKIDKVIQPAKDLVLLSVRSRGETKTLLLSASPAFSRVHITEQSFEKLPKQPMFCMLLRKHITGAVIERVEQLNQDKLLCLSLNYSDEYGRAFREKLYAEMIPGKINIVLVDEEGLIVDCIHRRDYEPDLYRRVFPGMIYHLPRLPESFQIQMPYLNAETENSSASEASVFISPNYPSLSAYLDDYYSEREKQDLYRRQARELRIALASARKRIEKKLGAQRMELKRTEGREMARRHADLITANIYRMKKGDTSLICEDFYAEGCPVVTLSLDGMKTPQENAARLYREYNKLKTAEKYLTDLIDKAEQQIDYIASASDELERARSNAEIEGIREELTASGIIRLRTARNSCEIRENKEKNNRNKKSDKKGPKLPYLKAETPEGLDILIGRNNLQNDELTFKVARKTDLWFHVRDYHGSHVILRTLDSQPSDDDLMAAARQAALNSQVADHMASPGGVSVDYTLVRYVHKPAGALPGKVIYTNQRTVHVK